MSPVCGSCTELGKGEVRYCLASGVGSGVGRGERERAVRRKPEALSTDVASQADRLVVVMKLL